MEEEIQKSVSMNIHEEVKDEGLESVECYHRLLCHPRRGGGYGL